MKKFRVNAEIVEVNQYDFEIEAENQEEADVKLRSYLETNCPYPYGGDQDGDVRCTDREPAVETREVETRFKTVIEKNLSNYENQIQGIRTPTTNRYQ